MPTLSTLVSFNGNDGGTPAEGLIADGKGDLFGTNNSGANSNVFEIIKTTPGYASTPTILASINGVGGATNLVADAQGDLFGSTPSGGPNSDGTIFEIAKTKTGYASTPTTLASFNGSDGSFPLGRLVIGARGDVLGTTIYGGTRTIGTVFEVAKTNTGYASTPTTLVNFQGGNGASPEGGLIADAQGNLFGLTHGGAGSSSGTVYEIAKTATGYAGTATTLVGGLHNVSGASSLIVDARGDLFGITSQGGGLNNDGTIFEIARTATGYASTATTLVTFNGSDGAYQAAGLIIDAKGNLFGTTSQGGAKGDGTVFEVSKTATGYASTPTTLLSFNGTNGADPIGNLIADARGDLFGTTDQGGASGDGTAFEITNSGFQVSAPPPTITAAAASVMEHGRATIIGYVTPGVAGDPLVLKQTGGGGTIQLGAVTNGTQAVIYDGPAANGRAPDKVTYSITDQTNGAVATGTAFIGGNGNQSVSATGNTSVILGGGHDTVKLSGTMNAVALGHGHDTVSVTGGGNRISLESGHDTVQGGTADTILLTGNGAHLNISGFDEMVFLGGSDSVTDMGQGLTLKVAPPVGHDILANFGADLAHGVIDLLGRAGGYTSASQAFAALRSDGHGGSLLALGHAASLDILGVTTSHLHTTNFAIG